MQNSRFVTLTGHLNEYPLSDLVGILRHQRKTGRLLIEYQKGPALFHFCDGQLIDAQLNKLTGLQAVCVALAQPAAPFNFNPLIKSPRRSIENSKQRVVSELLGCWDESPLQLDGVATKGILSESVVAEANSNLPLTIEGRKVEPLALPPAPKWAVSKESRAIRFMAASGLMMLGLSTVIAVTSGIVTRTRAFVPLSHSDKDVRLAQEDRIDASSSSAFKLEPKASLTIQRDGQKGREQALNKLRYPEKSVPADQKEQAKELKSQQLRAATLKSGGTAEDYKETNDVARRSQSVSVNMKIENGRVLQASIANHVSGMDAYEALALRIARQRRYPVKASGQQTIVVAVGQSN